jgi:hypothetical protein
MPLWAGQSATPSRYSDASALLASLIEDVSAIAGPVAEWSASHSMTSWERSNV